METCGLVEINYDKTIHPTKHGREAAGRVARRRRVPEGFLNAVLG